MSIYLGKDPGRIWEMRYAQVKSTCPETRVLAFESEREEGLKTSLIDMLSERGILCDLTPRQGTTDY